MMKMAKLPFVHFLHLTWGKLDDLDELDNLADLAVRALDALLDYQGYPVPAAKRSSLGRRSLGIGVINYAYYLAKMDVALF